MIPAPNKNSEVTVGSLMTFDYHIGTGKGSQAAIMELLRNSLYTNKELAILRELTFNGIDIHCMSGKADVPVNVTLPTYMQPTLVIRDYGTGLSPEQMVMYTGFGETTKRETDDAVGFMGIGAKSPFCYVDSFQIISYCGGFKRLYVTAMDASNCGKLHLLHEEPSDEVGLEIRVPVQTKDISKFVAAAQSCFQYTTVRPIINTDIPAPSFDWRGENGGLKFYADGSPVWEVVMGGIPYRLDIQKMAVSVPKHMMVNVGGVLFVRNGSCDVAASREEVRYTERTIETIVASFDDMFACFGKEAIEDVVLSDKISFWEKRRRIAPMVKLMPTIQIIPEVKDLLNDKVAVSKDCPFKFHFVEVSRGHQVLRPTETPRFDEETRVIFLEKHSAYRPYLREMNIIVASPCTEGADLGAFNAWLDSVKLSGVPVLGKQYLTDRSVTIGGSVSAKTRRNTGKTFEFSGTSFSSHEEKEWIPQDLPEDEPFLIVPIDRWKWSAGIAFKNNVQPVLKKYKVHEDITIFGVKVKYYAEMLAKHKNALTYNDMRQAAKQASLDHPQDLERCIRIVATRGMYRFRSNYVVEKNAPAGHPLRKLIDTSANAKDEDVKLGQCFQELLFNESFAHGNISETSVFLPPRLILEHEAEVVYEQYPLLQLVMGNVNSSIDLKHVIEYMSMVDEKKAGIQ